jgi:hypothetical protein
MKRRKFIFLSALAAGAFSVPFLDCARADPGLEKELKLPEILSQLLDAKSIQEIGKKYAALHPEQYSLDLLEQGLNKDADGKPFASDTPAGKIYATLAKRIQQDFDSANILILNGWVISETEARQCALFSLIPQQIK